MKNSLRKMFCTFLAFVFILSYTIPSFAYQVHPSSIHPENPSEPDYVGCPEGGKHLMVGIGYIDCYVSNTASGPVDFRGFGTQCNKCYLVLVTQYPANVSTCTMWGRYVVQTKVEPLHQPGFLTGVTFGYSSSIHGQYEQGFEFIITA